MADLSLGLTTVLSSTPAVSQVAGVVQDHPEVSRNIAQDDSIERLRKDRKEVLKSDQSATELAIKDDESQEQGQAFSGQEEEKEKSGEGSNPEADGFNQNPWSGHIINRRI